MGRGGRPRGTDGAPELRSAHRPQLPPLLPPGRGRGSALGALVAGLGQLPGQPRLQPLGGAPAPAPPGRRLLLPPGPARRRAAPGAARPRARVGAGLRARGGAGPSSAPRGLSGPTAQRRSAARSAEGWFPPCKERCGKAQSCSGNLPACHCGLVISSRAYKAVREWETPSCSPGTGTQPSASRALPFGIAALRTAPAGCSCSTTAQGCITVARAPGLLSQVDILTPSPLS